MVRVAVLAGVAVLSGVAVISGVDVLAEVVGLSEVIGLSGLVVHTIASLTAIASVLILHRARRRRRIAIRLPLHSPQQSRVIDQLLLLLTTTSSSKPRQSRLTHHLVLHIGEVLQQKDMTLGDKTPAREVGVTPTYSTNPHAEPLLSLIRNDVRGTDLRKQLAVARMVGRQEGIKLEEDNLLTGLEGGHNAVLIVVVIVVVVVVGLLDADGPAVDSELGVILFGVIDGGDASDGY